jgi:hypothetical protein
MELEFKGTKGKWNIGKQENKLEVTIYSNKKRICEVKSFDGAFFNDPTTEQAKANAQLIVSAPELLEALKIVKLNYEHFGRDSSRRMICRLEPNQVSLIESAIKKAIA